LLIQGFKEICLSHKSRYIIPNFFTGISFILGIYSILIIAHTYHRPPDLYRTLLGKAPLILAAWMIAWCVLLDKLDGFAAKIMKASSDFGAQFDSLADLIAFGVAPCFLVYFYLHNTNYEWSSQHRPLLIISLTVYVLCTSMRLARYNARDAEELGDYFHGLPSTFAGGFIAIVIVLFDKYKPYQIHTGLYYILPLMMIFLGILMVSPLYLPKLIRRKAKWLDKLQIMAIASGYLFGFGMRLPEYLFALLLIYGIGGFSYCFINRKIIDVQSSRQIPAN
jgi:CDP-diacylglycerol--serine O-phosphatidyltransferase